MKNKNYLEELINETPASETRGSEDQEPAEHSELYINMVDEIARGFARALRKHRGDFTAVSSREVADNCNVDKITIDFYYPKNKDILKLIVDAYSGIIAKTERKMEMFKRTDIIHRLLEYLSDRAPIADVLTAMSGQDMIEKKLNRIICYIAVGWEWMDNEQWNWIYSIFCFQFKKTLELWGKDDFSKDKIPEVEKMVLAWIAVDQEFAEIMKDGSIVVTSPD